MSWLSITTGLEIVFEAVANTTLTLAMPKRGKGTSRATEQTVSSDETALGEGITLPPQQQNAHTSLRTTGPVSRAEFNEVVEMLKSVKDVTGSSAVRERQALRDVVNRLEQRVLAAQEMFCTQHQKLEKNAAGWRKGLHDEVHAMQQRLLEIRKLAGNELSELKKERLRFREEREQLVVAHDIFLQAAKEKLAQVQAAFQEFKELSEQVEAQCSHFDNKLLQFDKEFKVIVNSFNSLRSLVLEKEEQASSVNLRPPTLSSWNDFRSYQDSLTD